MKSIFATLTAVAVLACVGQASALTLSGDVNLIFPPTDVTVGTLTNNNRAMIFREQANVSLASNLTVQAYLPGTYDKTSSPQSKTLNAGRIVTSFFLHADLDANTGPSKLMSGSITFNEQILGVIFKSGTFIPSDALVGLAGTTYETVNGHGVDVGSRSRDSFRISNNLMRLDFNFYVSGITDQIRIITAGNAIFADSDSSPIPEPVTPALLGMGLGCLALRRRHIA